MSPNLRQVVVSCFVLFVVMVMGPAAFGNPTIVNFDFGAVPILCAGNYAYQGLTTGGCTYTRVWPFQSFNSTPGFGWTLSGLPTMMGGSGLTGPNTSFVPPPFDGLPFTQAVALQGPSFVWQTIPGFTAGSYTLSFYLGSRFIDCCGYDGNQTVQAVIDDNVIGTWALSSFTPFTLQMVRFTLSTGGSHTLTFRGINSGDHTAFLSY